MCAASNKTADGTLRRSAAHSTQYRTFIQATYYFFVTCLAASASFFFCWTASVLDCFCADFFCVAFGDLSPMMWLPPTVFPRTEGDQSIGCVEVSVKHENLATQLCRKHSG